MISSLILILYGLFIAACIGIVIVLIVKRINEKGNEGFDERDW